MAPDELGVLLAAHCRHATTELPPGEPGVRWAADFLAVLPAACGRRLPDLITTGPKVFEFFVGQEFFAAMPSPRLVPLVLGLVARVSPLLQARSARQWALWLARVWDSGSPVLAAIRKRTPAHLIGIQAPAPSGPPLRSAQIRDERDRLVGDLASTAAENDRMRTLLTEIGEDRDRLAAELAGVVGRERRAVAAVAAERDRLAGDLAAATEQLRQASKKAATDGAQLQRSQALSDSLTAEIAGARAECTVSCVKNNACTSRGVRPHARGMATPLIIRVGELAERTGLTVRALHYYEEIGLLVPSHRSAAGHRLYTADDVARLHRISLLRGLGLALEQVAAALDIEEPAPLLALAERHLREVEVRIAEAEQLRGKLVALVDQLRRGEAASVDQLLMTIEVMTMIEKYYTTEQLTALKARADALGPEGMQAAQQAWQDLFREVRAAIARGADPHEPEVQALAARWQALINAFTGGDAGIRGSLDTMYRQEPGLGARVGGDPELFAFMQRALAPA